MPEEACFYAAIDEKKAGPFTMAQLRRRIGAGAVTADTLVWKRGMADWAPAGELAELAGEFNGGEEPPPLPEQSGDAG